MYGSETVAKDVLEYVVFEKHLPNLYGTWRLHHKIIPDWLPEPEPASRTYVMSKEEKELGTAKVADIEKANTIFKVPQ